MNQQPPSSSDQDSLYHSWVEQHGFADWVVTLAWIIVAFVAFQLTAGIVSGILLVIKEGASLDMASFEELMLANLDLLFIGNTTGQILFLGLATWFVTRLHTSRQNRLSFLRLHTHSDTFSMLGLTAVFILAVQPAIWFLSWINAQIPVPEFFELMQNSQMEMIEQLLRGDYILWATLFHVGVVPAICEEVLYRGYVMRSFEKSWGIAPAIILSGLLFGLYHVQLSNLLPLATIGIMLAYVTWVSRSLYPAILAHFINNGGSVLAGSYYPETAFAEITPESMPPIWAVVVSIAVSGYIAYYMYKLYKTKTNKGDANA